MPPQPAISINPFSQVAPPPSIPPAPPLPPSLWALSFNALPSEVQSMESSGQPETGTTNDSVQTDSATVASKGTQAIGKSTSQKLHEILDHPLPVAVAYPEKMPGHRHHHKDTSYIHTKMVPKNKVPGKAKHTGTTKDRLIPSAETVGPKGRRASLSKGNGSEGRAGGSKTTPETKAIAFEPGTVDESAHTAHLQSIDPYQLENELKNIQNAKRESREAPGSDHQQMGASTAAGVGSPLAKTCSVDENSAIPKNPPTSAHEMSDIKLGLVEATASAVAVVPGAQATVETSGAQPQPGSSHAHGHVGPILARMTVVFQRIRAHALAAVRRMTRAVQNGVTSCRNRTTTHRN